MESILFFARTRAKGKELETMEITVPISVVRQMEIEAGEYYGFTIEKRNKQNKTTGDEKNVI